MVNERFHYHTHYLNFCAPWFHCLVFFIHLPYLRHSSILLMSCITLSLSIIYPVFVTHLPCLRCLCPQFTLSLSIIYPVFVTHLPCLRCLCLQFTLSLSIIYPVFVTHLPCLDHVNDIPKWQALQNRYSDLEWSSAITWISGITTIYLRYSHDISPV